MSQDISERLEHCANRRLMSMAKTVAKWICTHALYIAYLIFFYPYILKVMYFISPLLIPLLATALCALSTGISNRWLIGDNETEDNAIFNTALEAEAYNIIFETFHDSAASFSDETDEIEAYLPPEVVKSCYSSNPLLYPVTSLLDESDETEAHKQKKIQELPPETIKSCCSSTTLLDPPLTDIAANTASCDENEQSTVSTIAEESAHGESSICNEIEIIKHMVCSTINKHQTEDDKHVKSSVEVEINKAESTPFTTTTVGKIEESNKAINNSQIPSPTSTTTTDLHKTNRSHDFSSIGSMRREKEWRRTLACKLFEERHNNRGGEDGMDMLWETIEESIKPQHQYRRSATTVSRLSSRTSDRSIRVYDDEDDEQEDESEENNDDDVSASGKMCCLQALKMSSGKVNLGIKTKNMIKFSKAFRGFGWLHKTTSRK